MQILKIKYKLRKKKKLAKKKNNKKILWTPKKKTGPGPVNLHRFPNTACI